MGEIYKLASEISREEGEERLARLVVQLLHDGRNDDILKIADKTWREKLYHEYDMVREEKREHERLLRIIREIDSGQAVLGEHELIEDDEDEFHEENRGIK